MEINQDNLQNLEQDLFNLEFNTQIEIKNRENNQNARLIFSSINTNPQQLSQIIEDERSLDLKQKILKFLKDKINCIQKNKKKIAGLFMVFALIFLIFVSFSYGFFTFKQLQNNLNDKLIQKYYQTFSQKNKNQENSLIQSANQKLETNQQSINSVKETSFHNQLSEIKIMDIETKDTDQEYINEQTPTRQKFEQISFDQNKRYSKSQIQFIESAFKKLAKKQSSNNLVSEIQDQSSGIDIIAFEVEGTLADQQYIREQIFNNQQENIDISKLTFQVQKQQQKKINGKSIKK